MSTYRALKSFVGVVNMRKGDIKELDKDLAQKLIEGGLVEALETNNEPETKQKRTRAKKEV